MEAAVKLIWALLCEIYDRYAGVPFSEGSEPEGLYIFQPFQMLMNGFFQRSRAPAVYHPNLG